MRFAAVLAVCALCFCAGASIAEEALELPYLPGETWLCSRGYNTATHRDYGYAWVDDRYALDFVLSGCNAYGRPILAVQSGVVKEAGKNDSYGRYLLIESPDGKRNRYGHNCQLVVGKGEWVKQGQVISFCGNTGVVEGHACTAHAGTHLHYVWYDDSGDGLKPEPISGNSDMREDIYYTSRNTNLFDMAYSRYGEAMIGQSEYQMWDVNTARRANPNHPWYNAWEPSSLYDARGMPQNCVVWNFDGGFFGDNAIVYDALGGARSAVVLHSGLWMFWTQRGGPINPAKMPIKDESNVPSNLRSYYHDHYKEHVGDRINLLDGITAIQECTDGCIVWANGQAHFVYYPFCAPGYYEDGWHKDTSYLFVECFNRHGGSQNVGHAIPGGSGTARVHDWGGYDVQDFQSPNGTRWVFFYDSNGAIHNPSCNTNEAYAVTGPILDHFGRNGDVAKYGCPTIDQFEINGHTAQDFYEWRSGKHWRLEYNGNNVEEIDLARCIGGDLVKATTGCTTSTDNLIANGNFASCLDCFDFHVEAGHPWASYETENAVCRIGFNNTDPARKYNDGWLYQGNLVLNPAKRYVLSGDISGDCGDAVTIAIGGETSGTWSLWQDRMPAWTDKHFSYIFQPQSADPTFALYLFFGRVHSSVWIGDLRLTEYVPPAPCTPDPNNMIANHDFRNRTDCLDIRVWPPEHGEINFATNLIEIVVRGNNSDIWSAQMAFLLYTITAGQRYAIEYEQQNVKSFETYVGLSDFENGQYYDCGFAEAYVQPPEAWVPHRYEFVAKRTTSVAKLAFGFGRIDGSMFRLRPIRMYPISTPPLTCVLDPNSYIGNGNFTSGVACWTPRYINLQWPGFTVQDDHSARLDVNGGRNYYEYTLLQPCAPLPTNRQLQLDLTLGAASPCSVFVAVGSEARHNFHLWKGYALRQLVDLPVHETITVNTPNPADTLYVYAGQSPNSVWVKKVSLKDGVITPPTICTPDPGNLISSKAECFRVEKPDGLYADVINADNGPQIRVERRGPIEQVKVTQAILIQAGTDYLLTGTLSTSSPGTVRIKIGNAAEQKWLAQIDYHLGTYVPQPVNLAFRNEQTTGLTYLYIMGGDTEGSVWFDRPVVAVKPLTCVLDPNSYIGNGNFTSGVACWTPRYINLQWPGFTVQDDHSARLDVNGGHNYYEYTLLQPCAPLPTNRQLQLDLTLGAASPCSVFIAVGSEAKHNFHLWKGYALRRLVDLPVHETITVTTPNPVDTLYLYAGKSTSSVWVKQISLKDGATQSVAEVAGDLVLAPNPMKGAGTVMRLTLETPANVLVEVYNVSGQRVRVLYDGRLQPGPRSIFWDGQDEHGTRVPSGLYFTRCRMNERTYTKTLIVVR